MRPQHHEIICYHCQQSAEKYLKGYLLAKEIFPPRTHEVELLCGLCSEVDNSFNEIVTECSMLTQFAVQPRYPYEMEISEQNVVTVLAAAATIKAFKPLVRLRNELESSATA